MPSLVKIRKDFGDTKLMSMIVKEMSGALNFFNNEMSAVVITSIAGSIAKKYYYLNVADIRLCFDNAKNGKYGVPFGSLSGVVVMTWINKYAEERLSISEENSYLQHDSITLSEKDRRYEGYLDKLWREREQINKPKPKPISDNQKYNSETKKWEVK